MRAILDIIEGPLKGHSFVLDRSETYIVGRSRGAHFPLQEDVALSRDHFLIEVSPSRCELRDLGSTNGTWVNEERVNRVMLKSGDHIAAGQSLFLVRLEGLGSTSSIDAEPTLLPSSRDHEPNKEALPGTAEAPVIASSIEPAPIRCTGCGHIAPPGIGVAAVNGGSMRESITWLCELCRAEVATTPQPVAQYRTLREIGRGAMGVVYLAQQVDSGRKVALKLIAPETAAARSAIDRFLREMNVVRALKHPNIVEYLEQGTTRGQFWFAMEYVDGSNLEALVTKHHGTYPVHQACRMAYQVLKGLEHAHGKGFVHRDIKPENILIGKSDNGLIAKISDFGLAKSYRSIGLSGLTFSGEMRGTIPFMPPEQIVDFKKVLPSGDLYSTAATLYYLISAKFIQDQPADGGDLIHALLEEDPVPIRERRREVPLGLEEVLMRCLARNPDDRYPDATAMRMAIRPYC